MAWDFAISEKQRADYTVGVCLMQDEADNLYLVDLVRFQGDSARIMNEFISMIHRWSGIPGSTLALGVEDGQIWKSLKNMLKTKMKEEKAYVAIEVMQALTDKQSRAAPLQGRMEHARMWFIEGSPWWKDTERELQRFPAGRNDDIVDALSWGVRLATGKKPKKPPATKRIKSWKEGLNRFVGGADGAGHMAA
jgi:predicted phage terminase large subunit-like protein